jgi:hypothetical protein
LVSEHQDSLQLELSLAVVEKVFKRRSEEVDDHDIVISFYTKPMDVGYTD